MAKRSNDKDVDDLTENWIAINEKEDPLAFAAWVNWRASELGCKNYGKSLTVPTPFPPSTVAAAREYIAILQQIRSSVGWRGTAAKLPTDVSAWMGK